MAVAFLAAASAQANQFIQQSRPMPKGRAFHGSAVLGDYLYVFGGGSSANGNRSDEEAETGVWKAAIAPNGHVGEWEKTTPIPGPRYYIANSTLVLNDMVYIIGGSPQVIGGKSHNTAIYSRPMPDGSLVPWQTSPPFGDGVSCLAAVATPGHVNIIGGLKSNDIPTNEVWSNAIRPDGSMGAWKAAPPLPVPLWFLHAGVVGGRVFVWGGIPHPDDGRPIDPSNYIFSAPILSSGEIGTWRREQSILPTSFSQAPTAVAGSYLMSFCPPYKGGVLSTDVWWSYVTPAGSAGWQKTPSNIPNRVYHSVAPDYRRGSIYLTGGRGPTKTDGMLPYVWFFSLSDGAREQAEQIWAANQTAHQNSVSTAVTKGSQREAQTVLSFSAETHVSGQALEGFHSIADARSMAVRNRMPLVMYFNIPNVTPCQEQKQILTDPQARPLLSNAAFAWVDTRDQPQLAQQLGVYRVPTWIFYGSSGGEISRTTGIIGAEKLKEILQQIRHGG